MSDETPSIQTFSCPTCGAPLEPGSAATLRCSFCKNVVIVPENLRPAEAEDESDAEARRVISEARLLTQAGNKIEAIKRLRAAFDIGLKEAKDMADDLEAGAAVEIPEPPQAPASLSDQSLALAEITRLAREGQKIEAIKLFRETFDVGLSQAKQAVEAIMIGQSFDLSARPAVVTTSYTAAIPTAPSPTTKTVKKAATGVGCFVTIMILLTLVLSVGVPIGAILFSNRSVNNPLNIVALAPAPIAYPPALLVASGSDTPPDVIATFYDPDSDTRGLARLNIAEHKSIWQTEPFEAGITRPDGLLTDGRLIFAAAETRLMAYKVDDGSLAWQASLPDRLGYCADERCFRLHEDRIYVMTNDDSLAAFDARTGVTAWNRRLNGYSDWIEFFNDTLVVTDRDNETYVSSLYFFDLATGEERYRLSPTCEGEFGTAEMDYDAAVYVDETEGSLYLLYGWSPGCVQKWQLETAQLVWSYQTEEGFFSISDAGFLPGADQLYYTHEGVIWETSRSSGETRQIASAADYELLPLALKGDVLLTRATNTRGTRKYELWGLIPTESAGDGSPAWQINFGEDRPLDPPDEYVGTITEGDMAWTWRLVGETLMLIKAETAPNEFVVETIDLYSGELLGQKNIPIQTTWDDSYSVPTILVTGSIDSPSRLVWLHLDSHFFAIDLEAGSIAYEWR